MTSRRKQLDPAWVKRNSQQIITSIQKNDGFKRAKQIALYKPLPGEVDLSELFDICWKEQKKLSIPVYSPKTKQYIFAQLKPDTPLCMGRYQIPEPCDPQEVLLDAIDLMLVPGVAFNPNTGERLGRGGGYYDRLLESFKGLTIGVGFSFQLYSEIPIDPTDQPLDLIITETKEHAV